MCVVQFIHSKMDVNDKENVPVNVKLVKTYSGRRKSKKLSSDGTPLTVSLIVYVQSSNILIFMVNIEFPCLFWYLFMGYNFLWC